MCTQAVFRSPAEALQSAVSQRQKEWGTSGRSVVPLHSAQGATRRLQCDLKAHTRVSPLCFTLQQQFHKGACIQERGNPSWPSPSHFTLATSSAVVKCDCTECKGAGVCIVHMSFLGRYYFYVCTFDWILKFSLIFEGLPNSAIIPFFNSM